jgi:hypothetical protein
LGVVDIDRDEAEAALDYDASVGLPEGVLTSVFAKWEVGDA